LSRESTSSRSRAASGFILGLKSPGTFSGKFRHQRITALPCPNDPASFLTVQVPTD
jgi:hypothetical protein